MARWWPVALLFLLLAGCVKGIPDDLEGRTKVVVTDEPLHAVADKYYDIVRPDPYVAHMTKYLLSGALSGDVRYHTIEQVQAKLETWNKTYPHLVEVDVIGASRQGRPLWRVVVTNEAAAGPKVAPLLDGGHHGNEYAGSEIMLYTVDLLLENWAANATVQRLLDRLEIHVVLIVNPDGYVAGTRHNGIGVNLNRNYDVDWGNPLGTSNPVLGQLGAATGRPVSGVALVAENCGANAFSEPETRAIRDVMLSLGARGAFYLTGHTPTHAVIAPPAAYNPPFAVPAGHRTVLDAELQWIRTKTEYEAGRAQWGDLSAGLPYAASGSSMDYWYAKNTRPGFTIEVEYFATSATAKDYPVRLTKDFEGLRYWMDATLPITMHLIANAENLAAWNPPTNPPLLPKGFAAPTLGDRPASDELPYLH